MEECVVKGNLSKVNYFNAVMHDLHWELVRSDTYCFAYFTLAIDAVTFTLKEDDPNLKMHKVILHKTKHEDCDVL